MKKLESTLTNMVLVLTGVAVIMGGILAFVNHLTEGPINEQKAKALADGIKTVMCVDNLTVNRTDTVQTKGPKGKDVTYIIYNANDAQGKALGAAGLGAKADKWFQKGEKGDIIGMSPAEPLTVSKDGGQVDAITASTITSRAFLYAVNSAYDAYKATPAADGETGATQKHE